MSTNCPACGGEWPAEATVCPRCGQLRKPPPTQFGGTLQFSFAEPAQPQGNSPAPWGTLLVSHGNTRDEASHLAGGGFASLPLVNSDDERQFASGWSQTGGGLPPEPVPYTPQLGGTLIEPAWGSGAESLAARPLRPLAVPTFSLSCSREGIFEENIFEPGVLSLPGEIPENSAEGPSATLRTCGWGNLPAGDPEQQIPSPDFSNDLGQPSAPPGGTLILPGLFGDTSGNREWALPARSEIPPARSIGDLGGTMLLGPAGYAEWTGPLAEDLAVSLPSLTGRPGAWSVAGMPWESIPAGGTVETASNNGGQTPQRAAQAPLGRTLVLPGFADESTPERSTHDLATPLGGTIQFGWAGQLVELLPATPVPAPRDTGAVPLIASSNPARPAARPAVEDRLASSRSSLPSAPSAANPISPHTLPSETDEPPAPSDSTHPTLQTMRFSPSDRDQAAAAPPIVPLSGPTEPMPAPESTAIDSSGTVLDPGAGDLSGTVPAPAGDQTDPPAVSPGAGTPAETRPLVSSRSLSQPYRTNRGEPVPLDFQVSGLLGRGGMGVVYRARQSSLIRDVAVKVMRQSLAGDPRQRAMFLDESILTAYLEHPNIVPVHELACDHTGRLFSVMKLIDGPSWKDVIGVDHERDLEVLMSVANAIAFAHSRGIVHRDLKPENVRLGEFGEVQVVDWGLALATDDFQNQTSLSAVPSWGYTPAYAPPELVAGNLRQMGPWSDIYLLGAILFQIETGTPPHPGTTRESCCAAAARNEIAATPRTGELLDIARKAMATRPADRHSSVQEFQEDLRRYLRHRESERVAALAQEALDRARQSDSYDDFSRALHGFEQSLQMWEGNSAARESLRQARLDYAAAALRREDLDQGLSLLQAEEPSHQPLRGQLLEAREYRAQRSHRERRLKSNLLRLGVATVLVSLVAATFSYLEKQKAETAQRTAVSEKQRAETAQRTAVSEKEKAEKSKADAEIAKRKALIEEFRSLISEYSAKTARGKAQVAEKEANTERDNAWNAEKKAKREEARAQYQAYVASIGKAQAAVDLNDFYSAQAALHTVSFAPPNQPKNQPSLTPDAASQDEPPPVEPGWEWQRLQYLLTQSRQVLYGPEDRAGTPLGACALHPRGSALVLGDATPVGTVRWLPLALPAGADTVAPHATTTAIAELASPVTSARWSDDGTWLAVGTQGGAISVWHDDSLATRAPVGLEARLPETKETTAIEDLVFLRMREPQPALLLLAAHDSTVSIWQLDETSANNHRPVPGRNAASRGLFTHRALAVVPEPGLLITAGDSRQAELWQVLPPAAGSVSSGVGVDTTPWILRRHQNQGQIASLKPGAAAVIAAAIDPTGTRVATAGSDGSIAVWDPLQVRETPPGQLPDLLARFQSDEPVRALQFGPQGNSLITCRDDSSLEIWDLTQTSPTRSHLLRGHLKPALLAGVPAGQPNWLVSAGQDGRVLLWNTATYRETALHDLAGPDGHEARGRIPLGENLRAGDRILNDIFSLDLSADGTFLAAATRGRSARLWPLNSSRDGLRESPPVHLEEPVTEPLKEVHWIPSAERPLVATLDQGGSVSLWDAQSAIRAAHIPRSASEASPPLKGQTPRMAISPDGQRLAVADENSGLRVYRIDALLAQFHTPETPPTIATRIPFGPDDGILDGLGFLPDRPLELWGVDSQKGVWIWSLSDPLARPLVLGELGANMTTAVGLPGGRLAVACRDGRVVVYLLDASPKKTAVWDTTGAGVVHLARLDDQLWGLIRISSDSGKDRSPDRFELQRWNPETGALLSQFPLVDLPDLLDPIPGLTGQLVPQRVTSLQLTRRNGRPTAVLSVAYKQELSVVLEADLTSDETNPGRTIAWRIVHQSDWQGRRLAASDRNAVVQNLALSPDGSRAASVGRLEARIWSCETASRWVATDRLASHSVVSTVSVAPDSQHVVTGNWDQSFTLWHVEPGPQGPQSARAVRRVLVPAEGLISRVAFFPWKSDKSSDLNRLWFLTAHQSGRVLVWSWDPNGSATGNPRQEWRLSPPSGGGVPVSALALSPAGNALAVAWGPELWVYQLAPPAAGEWRSAPAIRFDPLVGDQSDPQAEPLPWSTTRAVTRSLTSLAFSRDGLILALGTAQGMITLLETQTGKPWIKDRLTGHAEAIQGLGFTREADRLVSVSDDGTARLWNIRRHASLDDSGSRELLILRRPTVRDGISVGSNLETETQAGAGPGRLKGVVFLPEDRGLVTAGMGESGRELQLIVWPASLASRSSSNATD